MKIFRHTKITAVICILAVLLGGAVSSAQNQDRVTTPDSEVYISTSNFFLMSLLFLQLAFFVILIKILFQGAGGYG